MYDEDGGTVLQEELVERILPYTFKTNNEYQHYRGWCAFGVVYVA
jgi:hypothetical protein